MNKTIVAESENYGMGTVINHKVLGEQAEDALQAALKETLRLERLLSRFIPDSEISKINGSAGIRYEKVSNETYEVLSKAVELSKSCRGGFDITIGPLVNLWSDAKKNLKPPSESKIRSTLPLVNYTDMVLDPCKKSVELRKKGQSVDLGGIGKGFTADKVIEVFRKYEVSSAFTNFGGNVVALGTKPDGSPWRVGVRHPRQTGCLIGAVSVISKAVVTSGDYERYFIDREGKRRHHILNPVTGYPAESGLISVTVVADSAVAADALSTIIFVTGMEKGMKLLGSFPEAEAVLVDTELQVYVTRGLKDRFQVIPGLKLNIL